MNTPDKPLADGEAAGDGQAQHGGRTEVNWDGGQGRQPYSNRDPREPGPDAALEHEVEGGNRGDMSGRNMRQLDAVTRGPEAASEHAEQHQKQDDAQRNAE